MNKSIFFIGNSLLTMLNFRWHSIKHLADMDYKIYIYAPADTEFIRYRNVEFFPYGKPGRVFSPYGILRSAIVLRKKICGVPKQDQVYLFAYSPKIILVSSLATLGTRCAFIPFFIGLGALFIKRRYFLIMNLLCLLININKRCLNVVCLNATDQLILSGLLKNKNIKVLNGEGLPHNRYSFIEPNEKDKLRFILISRPLKEKGATLFIDTIKYFRDQLGMNANFSIYGFDMTSIGSDLPKSFTIDCLKYGVTLHGFVKDISNHVKSRDILVLPSMREGMSRVCMEMMEFGLPVIVSNVPGISDIVTNQVTGVLVSKMNPESFALEMMHFANLTTSDFNKLRLKIKNSPRRYASQDEIIEFYLSLLTMH